MSAFVAVVQGRKVFVVRHTTSQKWMLPGGKIDRHEPAKDAACRELREESGVMISNPKQISKRDNCTLFVSKEWPPRRLSLSKIFKDRTTPKETDSWGIATFNLQDRKWQVCVKGSKTDTSQTFRSGTVEHLKQLKPHLQSTFTDLTY